MAEYLDVRSNVTNSNPNLTPVANPNPTPVTRNEHRRSRRSEAYASGFEASFSL